MTKVSIFKQDDEYMISVTGHSGYKKSVNDNDIVCAAVSCLTETLSAVLQKLESENVCRIVSSNETVDACRIYRVKSIDDIRLTQTVETIKTGFELLENSYPDYVKKFFE